MRKEFTGISALSAIIAFTAGIVLCMQVSHVKPPAASAVAAPMLSIIEIAIFGTAVFAWQTRVSFFGWMLGIAGLWLMRMALVSGAAGVLAIGSGTMNVGPAFRDASNLLPRLCAVGFALMVAYPFRILLPIRDAQPRSRSKNGQAPNGDKELELLIVTAKERAANAPAPKAEPKPQANVGILSSAPTIDGEVELSLSGVLALMPENLVTDRALALSDTEVVRIPLTAILPQLKEAQVVFNVGELREWIPLTVRKALVQPDQSDIETENGLVALPLNLVVPQVPAEAFELPPPSPPAWAKVDADEHVVFATV